MGVWGTGPFDNDYAADIISFVNDAGAKGWSIVRRELKSGDPHAVVACGEIIVTALGAGSKRDDRSLAFAIGSDNIAAWARRYGRSMPTDLPAVALRAVERAARKDLGWSKPANARRWDKNVQSLIRRLSRAAGR